MKNPLLQIPASYKLGQKRGITSVCSAHPIVIEAALRLSLQTGGHALIEATCNQVNQDGGYTGMTPVSFRAFVEEIALKVGFPIEMIILGGDHLGPNPWRHLAPAEAMAKAEALVAAYASAGFTKLHLDTSMGCKNEPVALSDKVTAERASKLAATAEQFKSGAYDPVYVIGTEVPVPGGAVEGLDHLQVTRPDAVALTYEIHRNAFIEANAKAAFERVIAIVVQPGVEFGHEDIIHFDDQRAASLSQCLDNMPGLVFEAHSTDYQTATNLRQLVQNGFSILKVGPWLTFALRQALYGLDPIADVMEGNLPQNRLLQTMENTMLESPEHWNRYYSGNKQELRVLRHFSYSDRIRYYWPTSDATLAVTNLRSRLLGKKIPATLIGQFMPSLTTVDVNKSFDELLILAVQSVLQKYADATKS